MTNPYLSPLRRAASIDPYTDAEQSLLDNAFASPFSRSLQQAINTDVAGTYRQQALEAQVQGDAAAQRTAEYNRQSALRRMELPTVGPTTWDAASESGNYGDYVQNMLGGMAGSMAKPLVSASAGGLLGGPLGAAAGGFGGSYSAIRNAELEKYAGDDQLNTLSPEDQLRVTRNSALLQAAPEALMPAYLGAGGRLPGALNRVPTSLRVAGAVGTEGATEGLQDYISQKVAQNEFPDRQVDWDSVRENAIAGLIGGGAMGTLGHHDTGPEAAPVQEQGPAAEPPMEGAPPGTPLLPAPDDGSGGVGDLFDTLNERFGPGLREKAQKTKDYVSDTIDRMSEAAKTAQTPSDFLRQVFGNSSEEAAADLRLDTEDPGVMNSADPAAAMQQRDAQRQERAASFAAELLNDPATPDAIKERVASFGGDFTNPEAQAFVARNLVSQRAGEKLVHAVNELIDLSKDFGGKAAEVGTDLAAKARGMIDKGMTAAADRIVKKNLQGISLVDAKPLVDVLAQRLGPSGAAKAPELARQLLALSVRMSPDLRITPEIDSRLRSLSDAIDDDVLDAVTEVSGSDGLRQSLVRIREIPSAQTDVATSDGSSFLESMLVRPLPDGQRKQLALVIDEAGLQLKGLNPTRRDQLLTGLAAAFGSKENAQTVVEFYGNLRREAMQRRAESGSDSDDTFDQSDEDVAYKAPRPAGDAYEGTDGVAEFGTLPERDAPEQDTYYADAKSMRPFYEGREGRLSTEGGTRRRVRDVEAFMDRMQGRGMELRSQRYGDFLKERNEDSAEAVKRIRKDLEKRIAEGAPRKGEAAEYAEGRKKNRQYLEEQLLALNLIDKADGPEAAANLFSVARAVGERSELGITDAQLAESDTLLRRTLNPKKPPSGLSQRQAEKHNRDIAKTKLVFNRTDGAQPLVLSAESLWKAYAKGQPAGRSVRQLFADAVSAVLNRPDIADLAHGLDGVLIDRESGTYAEPHVSDEVREAKKELAHEYEARLSEAESRVEAAASEIEDARDEDRADDELVERIEAAADKLQREADAGRVAATELKDEAKNIKWEDGAPSPKAIKLRARAAWEYDISRVFAEGARDLRETATEVRSELDREEGDGRGGAAAKVRNYDESTGAALHPDDKPRAAKPEGLGKRLDAALLANPELLTVLDGHGQPKDKGMSESRMRENLFKAYSTIKTPALKARLEGLRAKYQEAKNASNVGTPAAREAAKQEAAALKEIGQMVRWVLERREGGEKTPQEKVVKKSFVGAKYDPAGAAEAEAALDSGADAAAVWSENGWFRGPDGKMRKEVNDDALFRKLEAALADKIRAQVVKAEAKAGPGKGPAKPEAQLQERVVLPKTSPYAAKDQAKSDRANKFIGRGAPGSSTAAYAEAWGDRANTGVYASDDIVFISVNGNRPGALTPPWAEIKKAMSAGATLITDVAADRARDFNTGERAVADFLDTNGYFEKSPGTWVHGYVINNATGAKSYAPLGKQSSQNRQTTVGDEREQKERVSKQNRQDAPTGLDFNNKRVQENLSAAGISEWQDPKLSGWGARNRHQAYHDAYKKYLTPEDTMAAARAQRTATDQFLNSEGQAYINKVMDSRVPGGDFHAYIDEQMKGMPTVLERAWAEHDGDGQLKAEWEKLKPAEKFAANTRRAAKEKSDAAFKARMDLAGIPAEFRVRNSSDIRLETPYKYRDDHQYSADEVNGKFVLTYTPIIEPFYNDEREAYEPDEADALDAEMAAKEKQFYKDNPPQELGTFDSIEAAEVAASKHLMGKGSRIRKNSFVGAKSAMGAKKGRPGKIDRQKILDEIRRIRGDKVKVIFQKLSEIGSSGEFSMNKDKTERLIKIAVNAAHPLGVAWHESLHDFFAMLGEDRAGRSIKKDLLDAAEAPQVKKRLRELLAKHPAARKQIEESAEERVAYMYQFWAEGLLTLGPTGTGIFERVRQLFRDLFGLISTEQRAADLLTALHEGKFAEPSTVAEVLADMSGDRLGNKMEKAAPELTKALGKVFQTAPDRLRAYQNDMLNKLADMFSSESGELGFIQRRFQQQGVWENKLAGVLAGTTAQERRAALENLQAMKPPSTKLEKNLAEFFSQMHGYMVDAGVKTLDSKTKKWVPLREVKGYFPRVFDHHEIMKDRAGFISLLQQHGNMDLKQASAAADALTHGTGQLELAENEHALGFTPYAQAVQDRRFTFINPSNASEFAKYQVKDLADVTTDYVKQAVHRAEYSRMFGNDGEVITKMISESGIKDRKELEDIGKVVQGLEGSLGNGMSTATKELMSGIMTLQNVVVLPLAIFSQMIDPVVLAARSGELKDAGNAYMTAVKRLTGKEVDGEELANMLGIISQDSVLEAMGAAYGTVHMSKRMRDINRVFFKYNGMQGWNNSMRIAATAAGERYLISNKGNDKALTELGLTSKDVKVDKNGRLDVSSPKVQQAMFRFVDQAVLRPSASNRPVWMSDPRFLLVAHLKQFTYAMHNVVLKRASRELADGNPKPWGILMLTMPVILAADMAKFALTGTAPSTWGFKDYLVHAVERSGLLGLGDFGVQATRGVDMGKMPGEGLAGPTFEHLMETLRWIGGDPRTGVGDVIDRTVPGSRFI